MFLPLLRKYFGLESHPARRARLARWHRPRLEALEDRWVPATVTTLLDDAPGSLREAIALTEPGGTVDFEPGLSGTITLTAGQLTIATDLTIAGPGADVITVSGNDASRVFEVTLAATVAISGLTIADGQVTGTNNGGGILNAGTLTITDCTLSGNSAGNGGGIFNSGTLIVTASTLSGNFTLLIGGGIYNSGTLTVTVSTLSGNLAGLALPGGLGGGIYNSGTLTVTASTLSGNTAGRSGGGIYNSSDGTLAITASTFSGNFAFFGAGGISNDGTASLRNTILAGNRNNTPSGPSDVSGVLSSQGHNLIGIGDGGGFHPTDLVGTAAFPIDPLLGPLADNGGPTLTHLPLPGSPAINAGDNADAPATDQRGFPRIVGGVIDIGAVELQAGSIVQSVVINDGAAQRSLVTRLTITFTGPDAPAPDAFEVRQQGGGSVEVNVSLSLVGGQAVAVLTFAGPDVVNGSLADGRYLLTIRGAGEAGGDFVFGDDPTEAFFRRYGDVDGDGLVTAEVFFQTGQSPQVEYGGDFGALVDALGNRLGDTGFVDFLDANGDGVIDAFDLAQYRLDEVRSTLQ